MAFRTDRVKSKQRLRQLSAQGGPLEKLSATVDFELFRADLGPNRRGGLARQAGQDASEGCRRALDGDEEECGSCHGQGGKCERCDG